MASLTRTDALERLAASRERQAARRAAPRPALTARPGRPMPQPQPPAPAVANDVELTAPLYERMRAHEARRARLAAAAPRPRPVRAAPKPPPEAVAPRNVLTPNLGLNMPDVGGDLNIWGGLLNQNALTLDTAVSDKLTDAPSNGSTYGRLNANWTQVLPLTGGIMTGYLGMAQSGQPALPVIAIGNSATGLFTTSAGELGIAAAASQVWAFGAFGANASTSLNMTGNPITSLATPQNPTDAVTKAYVDAIGAAMLPDAPADGSAYGRLNAAWTQVLPLTGGGLTGTLTIWNRGTSATPAIGIGGQAEGFINTGAALQMVIGGAVAWMYTVNQTISVNPLTMSGAPIHALGTPALATDAATKGYVDGLTTGAPFLPLAGGVVTGQIMGNQAATPGAPAFATSISSGLYPVGASVGVSAIGAQVWLFGLGGATAYTLLSMSNYRITNLGTPTQPADAATKAYADAMLPLAGGTMSGQLVLPNGTANAPSLGIGNPGTGFYNAGGSAIQIVFAGAATWQYASTLTLTAVPLSMSGAAINSLADPQFPSDAATKAYVDSVAGGGGIIDAPIDGFAYGRQSQAWAQVLPLTGGIVTGWLTVVGASAENTALYVNNVGSPNAAWFTQNISGGSAVHIQNNNGTNALNIVSPASEAVVISGTPNAIRVITGAVLLAGNATAPLHAVPLQQLNSSVAGYLPLAGGTIAGDLAVDGTLAVGSAFSAGSIYTGGPVTASSVFVGNLVLAESPSVANYVMHAGNTGAWSDQFLYATGQRNWLGATSQTLMSLDGAGNLNAVTSVQSPNVMAFNPTGGAWDGSALEVGANAAACYQLFCDSLARFCIRRSDEPTATIVINGATGDITTPGQVYGSTIASGGDCNVAGRVFANGIYPASAVLSNNYWLGADGNGWPCINFWGSWLLEFSAADGSLSYMFSGSTLWGFNGQTGLFINNRAGFAGNGAYENFSDWRGKTSIKPAEYGLAEILQLQPVTFTRAPVPMPTDPAASSPVPSISDRGPELGFVAQDVQPIIPEAVSESTVNGDTWFGLRESSITAVLVNAVKQLAARVDALEAGALA